MRPSSKPANAGGPRPRLEPAELRWALGWAMALMLLTCLPYLYVARFAPPGSLFSGLLYMRDDHCVYLAWEQQAAQGHFFLRNLFTGDPQRGIYLHLLSWLIGSVARFTGIPLILVHHAARVVAGTVLLTLIYAFFARFTADRTVRRAAFGFAAVSAGFGALIGMRGGSLHESPVDLWQPEAITFMSLYVNGLFCVALALMLGVFLLLLGAEEHRGVSRWGRVAGAGVLALLLGNIHSYEIITLAVVWGSFLVVRCLVERRIAFAAFANALVAAILASPGTAYQFYLYRTEPVFRMRADDPTPSPSLIYYLEGYGLVLLLAIVGFYWLTEVLRKRRELFDVRILPLVWSVVGFALPFLPFAFQRKLVMGLHLPLAFLAGAGAVALARWLTGQAPESASPRRGAAIPMAWNPHPVTALVVAMLVMTLPTNVHSLLEHVQIALVKDLPPGRMPTFLGRSEVAALEWAKQRLPHDRLILCAPPNGMLIPALTGRPVYAGHWSETPRGRERLGECAEFYREDAPEKRHAFLTQRGIRYVFLGPQEMKFGTPDLSADPHLRQIYGHDGAEIYEVRTVTTAAKTRTGRNLKENS